MGPLPGSGVPRRQAAWRIAPRPPFRQKLRRQRFPSVLSPRPQGPPARSGPGPAQGGWRGRGGTAGAGTRRTALKRRSRPAPSGFRGFAPAWGGGGAVQRRRGAGGRRGRAQRGQPSVKGIVPAPQSRAPARPLGAKLRAPRRARASSCYTSAGRLGARLAQAVPLIPAPLSSRAGSRAICPLIMIPPHKPPPAPFNSGVISKPMALGAALAAHSGGAGPAPSPEFRPQ